MAFFKTVSSSLSRLLVGVCFGLLSGRFVDFVVEVASVSSLSSDCTLCSSVACSSSISVSLGASICVYVQV